MEICGQSIKTRGRFVKVARLDADMFQFLDQPAEQIDAGLAKLKGRADLFTFLQRLPETKPLYPYAMEWDNFAGLEISTFENWWTKQIGFKARNKAKQAEKKGVVLREVDLSRELVEGIWSIYNETPIRQGRRFPHFGKSLETVYREEATYLDSSVFVGAYFDARLIGFIKLVFDQTRTQAGLMNIVSLVSQRDKAPTNALVAAAVRSCADRGVRYLTYSRFAYGKKQTDSLSDFKERNAFKRIDVPRYYIPLTAKGRIALKYGLHRPVSEQVPEAVASRLRDLREAWYRRKYSTAYEVS